MIDINFIRENPEKVKEGCRKKGVNVDIDRLLDLDKKRREFLQQIDELRHQRNVISENRTPAKDEIEKAKKLKEEIKLKEAELASVEQDFTELMFQIPNIPLPDVPEGKDENDNIVVKKVGKIPEFDFRVLDHLEIGEKWDLIDVKRAAKVSGTRFGYLKKEAALLEFALVKFASDVLCKEGFVPVVPPVLIKPEMMKGMGYIDTEEDAQERYFLEKDNLFLIGTAEQSIGPMHKDEIFEEKDLPKRYAAFSTCFREEAGSYGKDTRGILRVHQFDKIEMFSFSLPEQSRKEHEFLLSLEEKLMQKLELPYQVVQLCTGDLSRPSASTFDIETWIPSQSKYRETHSCSNCTDFQARRLNIRYKNSKTNKLEFVHTLNGTAFAIGRMIIAILENYQRKDGKIDVPKVLRKYLDFKIIPAK